MPWVGFQHGIVRGVCLIGVGTTLWARCLGAAADSEHAVRSIPAAALFRVRGWTVDEGLPNNGVNAILQSRDGFLWAATKNGLARFDGERFTIFDRVSVPVFELSDYCNDISEDQDGGIWVATTDGLLHGRDGIFRKVPLPDGFRSVLKVQPRLDGGMWACADGGLLRVVRGVGEVEPILLDPPGPWSLQIRSLIESQDGQLWLGNSRGLIWRAAPGRPFVSLLDESAASPFAGAPYLLRDRNGVIWWGRHRDVYRWKEGEPVRFWVRLPEASEPVRPLLEDSQGRIWWADQGGRLFVQRDDDMAELRYPERENIAQITSMMEDREGNLWCGTSYGGIFRLIQRQVRTYLPDEGLSHRDVWSVSEAPDGRLWIGTRQGLNVFEHGEFKVYWAVPPTPERYQSDNDFQVVSVDRHGTVWAGRHKLYRLEDDQLRPIPLRGRSDWESIRCIYHDQAGQTWVGGATGLYRMNSNEVAEPFMPEHFATNDVINVLEDAEGALWVGTYGGGVHRLHGDAHTVFTTQQQLLSNIAGAVLAEADGSVWIATARGLMHYKGGRFTAFTQVEGLHEDLILNLVVDRERSFWLNGHRGIQRVPRDELMAVVAGRQRTVNCTHIGGPDGMFNPEGNGGVFPNSCIDRNGLLWFPTVMGLVRIDPASMRFNTNPPVITIQSVKVDGQLAYSDGWSEPRPRHAPRATATQEAVIQCAQGQVRSLEVSYVGTSFSAPSDVLYECFLEGADQTWRQASHQRQATYTNLRPGRYVFHVRARNNHGVWNTRGASVVILVPPRFYQTALFYGLGGAALCGGFIGLLYYRRQQARLRLDAARHGAMEEQRVRIARDIHDELGATLTSIALMGEVMQQDQSDVTELRRQARRISRKADGAVDAISELVWATNPKYDSAASLVAYLREFAADFLGDTQLVHELDFPDPVPDLKVAGEVRRHLLRVLKEALRNVVRHAEATRVEVVLKINADGLSLAVTDNGRGMRGDAAPVIGDGLQNMRARIRELGGGVGIESRPGLGTTVTVLLPLRAEP